MGKVGRKTIQVQKSVSLIWNQVLDNTAVQETMGGGCITQAEANQDRKGQDWREPVQAALPSAVTIT